ncbi:MAG: hypothetical protein QGG02_10815 [Gammaproteobacteria bacterium]|jgi:fluoroquinolone transport system permease protein|nr:hypothetical protein [Gammaproteobacteria bacterium]MDP6731378.1 hypothetical protein [Gammaproteobacteria bacterium]|tara:strand:+ start:3788 stop:4525 length:738 start_codon:yes stop_codon:yes gene_type:complete
MLATQWQQVIISDLRKVLAEPFFWLILLMPFLLGWGLRYLLPSLAGQFQNFDLRDYYPIVVALLILTPPLYYGVVMGLLLLEEKDENVLLAVAVTPITLRNYLFARVAVYTLVSLPLIFVVHELIDVIEIDSTQLALIAIVASLNTPLVVMLMAAFCKNQLEGFVIGKGMSPFLLLPLAMFFVPDYWHILCGILPTYWPIIAYFTAVNEAGSGLFFGFAIVMAIIMQLAAIVWLYRRFDKGLMTA